MKLYTVMFHSDWPEHRGEPIVAVEAKPFASEKEALEAAYAIYGNQDFFINSFEGNPNGSSKHKFR